MLPVFNCCHADALSNEPLLGLIETAAWQRRSIDRERLGLHCLCAAPHQEIGLTAMQGPYGIILNPAVGDCMFGPNRRNSKRWTHFSQRFRLTLRVNNHR